MGEVYTAEDMRLQRTVALKFLTRELTFNAEAKDRFTREAQAAGALDHPNICTIYEVDETADGLSFIAMAYCEGESLRQKIERGPLAADDAIAITMQIAAGLKKAHENGIVHRDIKPANVIITTGGTAKIVDFGLAKLRGRSKLTKETSTVGTVEYMSPEQARGEDVDHRTDIWSLGCLLYEMLTGQTPFKGEYEQAVIYSIMHSQPKPVTTLRGNTPMDLEQIVKRTLEKDPAERYQAAADLIADLSHLHHSSEESIQQTAPSAQKIYPNRKRVLVGVGALLIFAVAITIILMTLSPVPERNRKSVAVLPFLNLTENKEDDYFSEGITDDILTQLYKIGDLKVTSRTTMNQYKETNKSIREIGSELNADAVLEGSIRRDGNRVRIVAQLIDVRNDDHLWAENYDREMNDVFAVQTEIAQEIAGALQVKLTASERSRLMVPAASNLEAYNLILQGGYHFTRGTRQDVDQSIVKFKQALSIDPNNARAWAQLATSYARQADIGALNTEDGYSKARDAAENALALDDQLAQAHTIMGWIKRSYDWDWEGAEAECRKALELAPGDVTVIRNMANMEKSLGRFDEAIRLIKKAADLDPKRVPIYTSLGLFSMYAGRLEEAAGAYQRAIDLNPEYPIAHTFLGLVYLLQGNGDKAIIEIQHESDEGWRLYGLAQAYYGANRQAEADTSLGALARKYGSESGYQMAEVYAYRGEADRAFEWLERAYSSRDGGLSEIKGDPFMKKIEGDRRYVEFIKKMKLPLSQEGQ